MRILVAEEEPSTRAFLVRALTAEGFHVDHAADAVLALRHAVVHDYDLAIVDIGMPSDGLGVLQRFHDEVARLPVVVLCGSDDLATKLLCFKLGAVDYLSRPFSIEELLARTRVHLRRRVAHERPLLAGPLALDEQARQAILNGRIVSLSDREFRVLRLLLTHAGEVVSRERLLSAVWGYDFDPGSNVVEVSIRRLRRRLGPDAPIETVRNAGYRIALGLGEREAFEQHTAHTLRSA